MELVETWIHDTMREYKLCVLMASHVLQDLWSALSPQGYGGGLLQWYLYFQKGIWLVFVPQAFKDPG